LAFPGTWTTLTSRDAICTKKTKIACGIRGVLLIFVKEGTGGVYKDDNQVTRGRKGNDTKP
jgi:hypothetical protein